MKNADTFGISNLYQLRGRVGRATQQAYAYLFYNTDRATDQTVRTRLAVIEDTERFGTGLSIALKDLEIRGAGNILGKQQSGDICAVGYEMYTKMLSTSIHNITQSNATIEHETYLELEYEGYIPDEYIPILDEKLSLYQQIAFLRSKKDIHTLSRTLIDRYGPLPSHVEVLFQISAIRITAAFLWITHIKQHHFQFHIHVHKMARLNQQSLLNLIQSKRVQLLSGKFNLAIRPSTEEETAIYMELRDILFMLQ